MLSHCLTVWRPGALCVGGGGGGVLYDSKGQTGAPRKKPSRNVIFTERDSLTPRNAI